MSHVLVFDRKLRRPACVLLQVAMGGTVSEFSQLFDSRSWLIAPTEDMKAYKVTEEQLQAIAKRVNAEIEKET